MRLVEVLASNHHRSYPTTSHSHHQHTHAHISTLPNTTSIAFVMSSIIGRTAFRAAPRLRPTPIARRWATTAGHEERAAGKDALKQGAKRDPELYVRLP